MSRPLDGKVAIFTGAGALKGIGAATVRALCADGATVLATDINEAGLTEVGQVLGVETRLLDITQRDQIDACVASVVAAHGRLDILINNAATAIGGKPFLEVTPDDWEISFRVNIKGTADFCQAVIPQMQRQKGGCIINLSSMMGLGGQRAFGAYTTAKHALIGMTKTIADEFGPENIRCTAICPGFVSTDMHEGVNARLAAEKGMDLQAFKAERYQQVALRRAGEPAEIGGLIAFTCGPAGAYITGVALPVTGGVQLGL
ncbi:MAG: SDR family oxidoreductase [Pseudomonadota bacterium]